MPAEAVEDVLEELPEDVFEDVFEETEEFLPPDFAGVEDMVLFCTEAFSPSSSLS